MRFILSVSLIFALFSGRVTGEDSKSRRLNEYSIDSEVDTTDAREARTVEGSDALKKALSMATAENEVLKRELSSLRERHAVPVGEDNSSRSLQFINAVRVARANEMRAMGCLLRLSQLLLVNMKSLTPKEQSSIELHLKEVDGILAEKFIPFGGKELTNQIGSSNSGAVVAVNLELNCIVLNLGERDGVRLGMPINIKRGNETIASARIVDIRRNFTGAVLLKKNNHLTHISPGDIIEVESNF